MPPPSPVWAWDFKQKPYAKVYHDCTLQMDVKIEGKLYESRSAHLKVRDPNAKELKKGEKEK
jgi:hypothetical protein